MRGPVGRYHEPPAKIEPTLATAKTTTNGAAITTNRTFTVTQATARAILSTEITLATVGTKARVMERKLSEHSPSTRTSPLGEAA
jgi:hypothetical protein